MIKKEKYLGEFEHLVLLAVIQLKSKGYGASIRKLLDDKISRDVAIGALYLTLERLEKKGMVSSMSDHCSTKRGGRPRKYFDITAKGRKAINLSKSSIDIMWQGIGLTEMLKV
jgi:PadR family transcriptional regulator PadR